METFGFLLRRARKNTKNPKKDKPLTQEELAEEIGYAPAIISYWENNQRAFPSREVVLSLIEVLFVFKGIGNSDEANALLTAAQYSSLTATEIKEIMPGWNPSPESTNNPGNPSQSGQEQLPEASAQEINERFAVSVNKVASVAFQQYDRFSHTRLILLLVARIPRPLAFALLWVSAAAAAMPALNFPYPAFPSSLWQSLLWGVSSICIPLVFSFLVKTEQEAEISKKISLPYVIWTRKLLGAWLGYQLGQWIVLIVALIFFHTEPFHRFWPWLYWGSVILLSTAPLFVARVLIKQQVNQQVALVARAATRNRRVKRLQSWDGFLPLIWAVLPLLLFNFFASWPSIYWRALMAILLIGTFTLLLAAIETINQQRPGHTDGSTFWLFIMVFIVSFAPSQLSDTGGWKTAICVLTLLGVAAVALIWPYTSEDRLLPFFVASLVSISGLVLFLLTDWLLSKIIIVVPAVLSTLYFGINRLKQRADSRDR